ncbi:MAG: TOBE domain-containing protein, partial [Actinomycetota bacterium]|nr:TOBE domain-containing protein [Actinomycetota bacterium]
FIGSPSMNLVPVEAGAENGRPLFVHDGFRVEVPERLAGALGSRGNGCIVGFRPEHVQLAPDQQDGEVRIPCVADVVEYLGDEQLVHLHAGEVDLVAKLRVEERIRAGQDVCLSLPASKLHVFDRETEESISLS